MDEVYSVAGHKGQPDKVAAQKRQGRRRRLKGQRGRGTAEKDKPPVLGTIERGGQVLLKMLNNVQQKTIQPIIERHICKASLIYTDEYNIYERLTSWGYEHKSVCHAKAEYARDEDGDGFCEIHINSRLKIRYRLPTNDPQDFQPRNPGRLLVVAALLA